MRRSSHCRARIRSCLRSARCRASDAPTARRTAHSREVCQARVRTRRPDRPRETARLLLALVEVQSDRNSRDEATRLDPLQALVRVASLQSVRG